MEVNLQIGPEQFQLQIADAEKGFEHLVPDLHGALSALEKQALNGVFEGSDQETVNKFWQTIMVEFTPEMAEMLSKVKDGSIAAPPDPDQALRDLFRVVVLKRIGWVPGQTLSG